MRTGKLNSDKLLFWLVLFVVSLNMVLPGETWFQTKALSQLLVFAGFGALLVLRARDGDASPGILGRTASLFSLFLIVFLPSMLFSACAGRSLETLVLWLTYFCLFILVRRLPLEPRRMELAITVIGLVTAALLLYGLYQYFTGFGGLAGVVAADPTLSEGQRADMLSRLASRRVFSTFPLPTTFAELIVIILPLLLHRARAAHGSGRRPALAGWGTALLLALLVLPLTGSYGALPVLAALGFIALLAGAPRWSPRRRAVTAGVALLCVTFAFVVVLQVRGFTPWAADQSHNPVSQRLFNWRSAASIWNEHPLTGAGPGNFGLAYARHRLPGANETMVAHNTWLHAAAEGGVLPGLSLAVLGLLLGWRTVRRLLSGPAGGSGAQRAFCYAVLALLLYSCFEITVEFPGIGYPGVFLIALASRSLFPRPASAPASPAGGTDAAPAVSLEAPGAAVLALILSAAFLFSGTWYCGQEHHVRALALAAEGPSVKEEALQAARAASRWNPLNPEPHALRGALLLSAGAEQRAPETLREAGAAFQSASALDPDRAFFHERSSVVHEGLGQGLAAFLEADKAWRLYPLQPRYQNRRAELLRRAGGGS